VRWRLRDLRADVRTPEAIFGRMRAHKSQKRRRRYVWTIAAVMAAAPFTRAYGQYILVSSASTLPQCNTQF
jgi:hypothetical protein